MGKNHGLIEYRHAMAVLEGRYAHITIIGDGFKIHLHHRENKLEMIVARPSSRGLSWENEQFSQASVREVVSAVRLFEKILEEIEFWFQDKEIWCEAGGKRYAAWSKVAARFPKLKVIET